MGTKELGWPAAGLLAVRFLALTLSVSTVVVTLAAARIPRGAVPRIPAKHITK